MITRNKLRYHSCTALVATALLWPMGAIAGEQADPAPEQANAASFSSSNPNLNEWSLIGLTEADATSATDGLGVKVAVLDGRTDCRNSALADHCVNYGLNGASYTKYDAHGTHVAGIVGANPFGVAPAATILNYGVYADSGWVASGTALSDTWKTAYAAGAQISSMSFGCPRYALCFSGYDLATISKSSLPMLFVKAAGNDGSVLSNETTSLSTADAVAALNKVLLVGSVNAAGGISSFSNRPGNGCLLAGGATSCTDELRWKNHFLVAPGEGIYSTLPNGGFGSMSGTSMATPVVAGVAALLQARWPALKNAPETLAQILLTSATDLGTPGVDEVYGYGLLNAANAFVASGTVTIVSSSGTTTSLTPTSPTTTKGKKRRTSITTGSLRGLEAALGSVTVYDKFGRDFRLAETAALEYRRNAEGLSVLRSRRILGAVTQDSWAPAFFASTPQFKSYASFSPLTSGGSLSTPNDRTLRAGIDIPVGQAALQVRLSGSTDPQADFAFDPTLRPLGFFASTNLANDALISNVSLTAGANERVMFYALASIKPIKARTEVAMQGHFLRNEATSLTSGSSIATRRSHHGVGAGYWKQLDSRTLVGVNFSAVQQRNGYLDVSTNLDGFDRPTTLINLGAVVSQAVGKWELTASGEITHARTSARGQAIGFTPAMLASAHVGISKSGLFTGDGAVQDSVRASLVVPPRATAGSLKLAFLTADEEGSGPAQALRKIPLGQLGGEPARLEAGYQIGRQGAWSLGLTGGADLQKSNGGKALEGLLTLAAAL